MITISQAIEWPVVQAVVFKKTVDDLTPAVEGIPLLMPDGTPMLAPDGTPMYGPTQ